VEEANALFEADYLSLWRLFLLVEPHLLERSERTRGAAKAFHRWARGWTQVSQSGVTLTHSPSELAELLSKEAGWEDRVRELSQSESGPQVSEWISDTTTGVDMHRITYDGLNPADCRDVRYAYSRQFAEATQKPRDAEETVNNIVSEPVMIQIGDDEPRPVKTEEQRREERFVSDMKNRLDQGQAAFSREAYSEASDFFKSVMRADATPSVESVQRNAKYWFGRSRLEEARALIPILRVFDDRANIAGAFKEALEMLQHSEQQGETNASKYIPKAYWYSKSVLFAPPETVSQILGNDSIEVQDGTLEVHQGRRQAKSQQTAEVAALSMRSDTDQTTDAEWLDCREEAIRRLTKPEVEAPQGSFGFR
jgi:hypothetical protein